MSPRDPMLQDWLGSDDDLVSRGSGSDLADLLERVLDKGVVIAGDISISLVDVELLTIKLRLLVASVDKAREMGIDWWEHDPWLSSGASGALEQRVASLEEALDHSGKAGRPATRERHDA